MMIYLWKICIFLAFYPSLFEALSRGFHSDLGMKVGVKKQVAELPVGDYRMILRSLVLTHYQCVTDA